MILLFFALCIIVAAALFCVIAPSSRPFRPDIRVENQSREVLLDSAWVARIVGPVSKLPRGVDCDSCGEPDAVHEAGALRYCDACWERLMQHVLPIPTAPLDSHQLPC